MSKRKVLTAVRHVREMFETYPPDKYPQATGKWWEIHTRYVAIDPVLWALGWQTHRPQECELEFAIGRKSVRRVDYALLDPNHFVVVLIEAKKPEEALNRHREQLAWYARRAQMNAGVGVLTNGLQWRFYNLDKTGRFDTKLEEEIDIFENPPEKAAAVLHLWLDKGKWWPGKND